MLVTAAALTVWLAATPAQPPAPSCGASPAEALARGIDDAARLGDSLRFEHSAACFRVACDGGNLNACVRLGDRYRDGMGVPFDLSEARRLLGRGCNAGDFEACGDLAAVQFYRGSLEEIPKAIELLRKSCDRDYPFGCLRLARLVEAGASIDRSAARGNALFHRGRALLEDRCKKNEPNACWSLGGLLRAGKGGAADPARGITLIRKACEDGEPRACTTLGMAYVDGKDVAKDAAKGLGLLGKACDQEAWRGCALLGYFHHDGKLVAQDLGKATELTARACDHGDAVGCQLAGMLDRDDVAPHDWSKALAEFQRACELGNSQVCEYVPRFYRVSHRADMDGAAALHDLELACHRSAYWGCLRLGTLASSTGDEAGALRWFRMGCGAKRGEACEGLAGLYRDGVGVPVDPAEAARLMEQACKLGDKDACKATKAATAAAKGTN